MLDPDFVHPAIVVPVVARLQLHKLPPNESRDWTRKALTKAGIATFTNVKKVSGYEWALVSFASEADRCGVELCDLSFLFVSFSFR